MTAYRLSMIVHALLLTLLFAYALLAVAEAIAPPQPDDPNADWRWLDLWVSGFIALAVLGYIVLTGLAVWLATGRKGWVPIAITLDLGVAIMATAAAITWSETGISPHLLGTVVTAIAGAILVARVGSDDAAEQGSL